MSDDYFAYLLARYRDRGALLDTNLMLLLAVGSYDVGRISTFKRTLQFTARDYQLLLRVLGFFERKIVTPNIITEVDNLSRQLRENEYTAIASVLAQLCRNWFELYVPAANTVLDMLYPEIGLTDTITFGIAGEGFLIITDDFPLYGRLIGSGRDALNLNHLRHL